MGISLKLFKLIMIISAIISFDEAFALTQESNIEQEIEELKQGQRALSKALQEIKLLLSQRMPAQAPPLADVRGVEFDLEKGSLKGSNKAQLILVEFTDYQCQFCSRHVRETLPQIINQYVNSGKIAYAIVDQPLASHPMAAKAAEASHCAADQNKYWEMHDIMMSKPELIDKPSEYAKTLNLDIIEFEECLKTNKYTESVRNDKALATKLGVTGVPGFILASRHPQNPTKLKGIAFMPGAQPFANFQKQIDAALSDTPDKQAYK